MYWLLRRLFEPLPFCFIVFGVLLFHAWWRNREQRRLVFLATSYWLVMYLAFSPLVARFASGSLQAGLSDGLPLPASAEAIVVLGGALHHTPAGKLELASDSILRCMHAANLQRDTGMVLVTCGGDVKPDEPGPHLAQVMATFLERVGVPPDKIVLEDSSTTTYENARGAFELLHERGIQHVVLVTHAGHMYRARRCFEKLGLTVHASPCTLRSAEPLSVHDLIPSPYAGAEITSVMHEVLGLLWYRLMGRI